MTTPYIIFDQNQLTKFYFTFPDWTWSSRSTTICVISVYQVKSIKQRAHELPFMLFFSSGRKKNKKKRIITQHIWEASSPQKEETMKKHNISHWYLSFTFVKPPLFNRSRCQYIWAKVTTNVEKLCYDVSSPIF